MFVYLLFLFLFLSLFSDFFLNYSPHEVTFDIWNMDEGLPLFVHTQHASMRVAQEFSTEITLNIGSTLLFEVVNELSSEY